MIAEIHHWLENELGITIPINELNPYSEGLINCYKEIKQNSEMSRPCFYYLRNSRLINIMRDKEVTYPHNFCKRDNYIENYRKIKSWKKLMDNAKGLRRLLIKHGYLHSFSSYNK